MSPNIIPTAIIALIAVATVNALSVDTALFARSGYSGQCYCPKDNEGSRGVVINAYPAYKCVYPSGHCTWDDRTGALLNTEQTNCSHYAPWRGDCPKDNNNDSGFIIDYPKGFQCAYKAGACTWNAEGALVNTNQTNCPINSQCA